ncbi:S-adenosyl-L-methionine-dependent methyltransferase [Amylostereum chailletii]|nr:S-adenosyl-L-methionine-dependent methyltransferase [Amylostereum chailletii]
MSNTLSATHTFLLDSNPQSGISPQNGLSELRALVAIIQNSVDAIEKAVEAGSLEFPSLSTPFTIQSEAARNLPEVAQAVSLLVAAATQLVAASRAPEQSMTIVALQHSLSSALRTAIESNVVEALREAGPQGAHVNDIAQASNIDPSKLGFDWKGLKQGALVVDVGGGVGAQSLTLAREHPHLRFVVQDRESVIKNAAAVWDAQFPDTLLSGRVVLQGHDFFTTQPVKNADVFLLNTVLHNWPDKYCVKILQNLRQAAIPSTRLLIADPLIGYACANDATTDIPGAALPNPPAPLLANLGHTTTISYYLDIHMMEMVNGKERTIPQIHELLNETGWKLAEVNHGAPGTLYGKVIAVPA